MDPVPKTAQEAMRRAAYATREVDRMLFVSDEVFTVGHIVNEVRNAIAFADLSVLLAEEEMQKRAREAAHSEATQLRSILTDFALT